MSARIITAAWAAGLCTALALSGRGAESDPIRVRVKELARVRGVEQYTLTGYGLVVGLAGSGDSDEELTQQTVAALLQNFEIVVSPDAIKAQNTAVVMVTATVHTSAHEGDMIPATVASIGDAQSLKGGELLLTPVLGPDGQVWAVGQGALSSGAFSFGGGGEGGDMQSKNHPTTAMLTNGVKLVRDVDLSLEGGRTIALLLRRADFTTAVAMADAINERFPSSAIPVDNGLVRVSIPRLYQEEDTVSRFIHELEQVRVVPDGIAKVVINERTGTIVFGGNVQISEVAVTHGNLTISIKNTQGISQPPPLSSGTTQSVSDQTTVVTEEGAALQVLPKATTVSELVSSLNALGVTPRDTIVILHALREAGALHAQLESI